MSTSAASTAICPADAVPILALSPIPEMTEQFPHPNMFPEAPPNTPTIRPVQNLLVIDSESPQRQRRFNQIVEDERRNFDFMNIPSIKDGEKRCFVMLTTFVALSI